MDLGAFSISLAVKDIEASKAFYEKLGFTEFHGDITQKWLIMKNKEHIIGLFEGMFPNNILTFNPGWDQNGQNTASYTDIREINQQLKSEGVDMVSETIEGDEGPANFMITDPDGNTILIDQHR